MNENEFKAISERYAQELVKIHEKRKLNSPHVFLPETVHEKIRTDEITADVESDMSMYVLPEEMPLELFTDKKESFTEMCFLLVQAFSAGFSSPVKNAIVTIAEKQFNGNKLIKKAVTDESGRTSLLELPAPPSEFNDCKKEFALYDICIVKPSYYKLKFADVHVCAGIKSILKVNMIPLPENSSQQREITYYYQ